MTDRWYSLGTPVSSTNKTDRHDITEILLKVALNTTKENKNKDKNKQQTNNINTHDLKWKTKIPNQVLKSNQNITELN